MSAPEPCSPASPGLEILGVCVSIDPVFEAILWVVVPIYVFLGAALTGPKWRGRVRDWLYNASWSQAYSNTLNFLIQSLDNLFGHPIGIKAIFRCILLAFLYSGGFLHLALNYNTGNILLTLFFFALLYTVIIFIIAHVLSYIDNSLKRRERLLLAVLLYFFSSIPFAYSVQRYFVQFPMLIEMFIVFTSAITLCILIFYWVDKRKDILTTSLTFILGLFAVAIGTFLEIRWLAIPMPTLTVFLVVLLPTLNALIDWLSWWLSRVLIKELAKDIHRELVINRALSITAHMLIDLVLAVIFFIAILTILFNIVPIVGLLGAERFGISMQIYTYALAAAATAPFSDAGLPITIMLLSTLVPTAVHLFFAVFALAAIRPPFSSQTARWLEEEREGSEVGTQLSVAAYLTACAAFGMLVLWAACRMVLWALDAVVGGTGIWPLIFETADYLTIF